MRSFQTLTESRKTEIHGSEARAILNAEITFGALSRAAKFMVCKGEDLLGLVVHTLGISDAEAGGSQV